MFQDKRYKKNDKDFIYQFIKKYPFATFVTSRKEIIATHIPILIQDNAEIFCLYGHIANQNEQIKDINSGEKALLIFKGPDSYVSSSWYKEKNISTWDYSAVHINCRIKTQTQEELINSLKKLVYHFEKNKTNPLFYQDLPDSLVTENVPKITGFWLYPEKIQGIAKLHQGFKNEDINIISQELEQENDCQSAKISKQIKELNGTDNK